MFYVSLPGIRLGPEAWDFVGYRVSRSPLVCSTILLRCSVVQVVTRAPAVSVFPLLSQPAPLLLNYYFLLVRIHRSLGVLGGYSDQVFSIRQRRREVMEGAIVADKRHLFAIDHDPRSRLRRAGHFDHVSVLHERFDCERQLKFFLALCHDGKTILF